MHKKCEASKRAYFTQLNGSIDTAMLILKKGLPFCGHNESNESLNSGNFLEVYDYLAQHDPNLGKAVGIAGNSCMVAHKIQTNIVEYFAKEIIFLKNLEMTCFACPLMIQEMFLGENRWLWS